MKKKVFPFNQNSNAICKELYKIYCKNSPIPLCAVSNFCLVESLIKYVTAYLHVKNNGIRKVPFLFYNC